MSVKGRPAGAPGLLARLDAVARAVVPGLVTVVGMVLAAAPAGLPSLVPPFALASVFFWSLYRPGAMPPVATFALGLLQDLLGFAPLGSGVLILLLAHAGALRMRAALAGRSFLLVWLAFGGVAVVEVGLGYALQAVLGWGVPAAVPALAGLGLTVGLYPLLAGLLSLAHRGLQRAEALA